MRHAHLFPVALSIQDACRALSVPRRIIRDAIDIGELVAFAGPGKRIRITVADLTDWIRRTWPHADRQVNNQRSRQ